MDKIAHFIASCKKGDFIVIENIGNGRTMIACYDGGFCFDISELHFHSGKSKFMIDFDNKFCVGGRFCASPACDTLRKPTFKEYLTFGREIKKHGLTYNKKKKELCPIMTL